MTIKPAFITIIFPIAITSHITHSKEASPRLEELIVTAQKRDESLSRVPIAIDVIDGELIENSGATGLSQLEFAIPSVNFGRGGRKTRGEIAIRGVGDFSRNIGTDGRVVVYIDDVPLGRSSAFDASLVDVAQIEVLKGPQGTFFGTNTIAGAINITTSAPSDTASSAIKVDAGERGHRLIGLTTNIPLSDSIAGRVQVTRVENDGFIDNIVTGEELQGTDLKSARFKLRFEPNNHFTLDTSFDWLEDETLATNAVALADDGTFNGFSFSPDPREVAHDIEEFENRELWGGSVKAKFLLDSGAEVVSVTAYRSSEFEELSEEDYSPAPAVFSTFDEEYEQYTQELRYASDIGEKFDFVVGSFLSYHKISTERSATLFSAELGDFVSVVTPGELEANTYSVFGQMNYRFTPTLALSVGLRAQHEEKELDYEITDQTFQFTNGTVDDDDSFSAFLPKISLNYYIADESMAYTSLSRGAKSGGWNADFVRSLDDIAFDQESATSFELGYKSAYYDGVFTINSALFVTKFDDYQVFQFVTSDGITDINLTNAGEVTSQGLELDLRLTLNEYASLSLNTAFTESEFDEFKDGGGPGIDFDGNTLPYAPEFATYASMDIAYPFAQNSEVYFHLDYSYSDDYFSEPENSEVQAVDSYYTVNGQLGVILNSVWKISLWGKNLTDELFLRSRDVSFLGIQRGYYEEPRTYGISVKYSTN